MNKLKTILKNIKQVFFPATCLYCQKIISYEGLFCLSCFLKLKLISPIKCKICSLPFAKQEKFDTEAICINCLNKKPFFDETHTIFIYNYIIGQAILDLKFKDKTYIAYKIANFIKINFKNVIVESDFIVSVPMHYKKLQLRGFNHANLIARNIDKKKYFINLLIRKKTILLNSALEEIREKQIYEKPLWLIPNILTKLKTKKYF